MRILVAALILVSLFSCDEKTTEKYAASWPDGSPKIVQTIIESSGTVIYQTHYYQDGGIEMQGGMNNGKKHGEWKAFYVDGKPWTVSSFDNGTFHGAYIMYNKDGSLKLEGHYTQGEETGHWRYYDQEGNLVREEDK